MAAPVPTDVTAIRRLLEKKTLTQGELAKKSGIKLRTIEDILSRGTASHHSLKRIAAAFGVDESTLLASSPSLLPITPRLFRLATSSEFCFGRDAEVATLKAAWDDHKTNIVVVVAESGYGKSNLVSHWLAGLSERSYGGAEGVYGYSFSAQGIDTSIGSEPAFLDTALKQWFHEQIHPDTSAEARGERLAELIRNRRTLLILDGLETLQRTPSRGNDELPSGLKKLLVDLALPSAVPFLCVITTQIPVSELGLWLGKSVRLIELGKLDEEAGIALLTKLKVKGKTDELRTAVEEWKGHPLSLTWLGTQLQTYGGDIKKRREVTGNKADYRIDRLFDSYERGLGEKERGFLRVLAFFDQPATWPEIMSLVQRPEIPGLTEPLQDLAEPEWAELLHTLGTRRLISISGESPFEQTIDFFHAIARSHYRKIVRDQPSMQSAWREGNWRSFLYFRGEKDQPVERTEDFIRLNCAVEHGCAAGAYQEVFSEVIWGMICRGYSGYKMHHFGLGSDDQRLVRLFFPHSGNPDPLARITTTFSPLELAQLHHWAAVVAHSTGLFKEAILRNAMAAPLFKKSGEKWGEAFAKGYLSRHHMLVGNIPKAIKFSSESVLLIEENFVQEHAVLVVALSVHAMTLHVAGRWDESQRVFERISELPAIGPGEFRDMFALHHAYYCEYLIDRHELLGEELCRTEIEHLTEAIPVNSLARSLAEIARGRCYLLAGEVDRAKQCTTPAVEVVRKVRNSEFVVVGFLARGRLNRACENLKGATEDVTEALGRACEDGLRLYEVDCRIELASVLLASEKRVEANAQLEEARRLAKDCGYNRALLLLEKLWIK